MSIMDLFRSSQPQQTQQTQQQQTQQVQQQQNPAQANTTQPNLSASNPGVDPKTGQMPGTNPANVNPLDAYAKMFDNATKGQENVAPSFQLDPKVLGEVATKMDFTKDVNQEHMTNALKGDASALMQVMQAVAQNAYKASLEHTSALTDKFLTQRSEYEQKQINSGVKTQLTQQNLASAPNYNHPVIKAELNRIASQMSAANPDASPQEIAQAAQKYISDIASALNPVDPNKNKDPSKPEEMDWSKYLTS